MVGMMLRLAIALVIVATTRARGESLDATFAYYHEVQTSQVQDVVGYELPPGGDFTHVLVGRVQHAGYATTGVVVMRCDSQCQGRRADFGSADAIQLSGVVDLMGAPAYVPAIKLPGIRGQYTKIAGDKPKPRWPALVVRTLESKEAVDHTRSGKTVTGKERRSQIYFISLAAEDRASVVLQDTSDERYPSGRGASRTYRLERGASRTLLDVVATEQREIDSDSRCLRPKPTQHKFALDSRHFKAVGLGAPTRGC